MFSSISTTLETGGKKGKQFLHLAIAAHWSSRHILWQYFDSYLLEVRKKRKVKGCRGEGGRRRGAVKKFSRSLCQTAEGCGSVCLRFLLFRGHRPGASVLLALLPVSARTPYGFSSPSSAALRRSGGGLGCWRRPGERRQRRRLEGKFHLINETFPFSDNQEGRI